MDVSRIGSRAMLRSPPKIRCLDLNEVSFRSVSLRKETCLEFGPYMFARVIGLSFHIPINLPSGSTTWSVRRNANDLVSRIAKPFLPTPGSP